MTNESAILRAYALLSQGQYDEAERMLKGAPEALNTPSGADLFARLRYEQGFADDARQIWQRIHDAFPDFEPAAKALDAFENPPPDDGDIDDGDADDESSGLSKRLRIAAIAAIAAGVMASVAVAIKGCQHQPSGSRLPTKVVTNIIERVDTKIIDRCVTNFVDKVRTEFVDRIVTNIVEKPVEVSSQLTLTNTIERIVCHTNQITVVVTNQIDILPVVHVQKNPVVQTNVYNAVDAPAPKKFVLSTPYVVRDGDTVGGLAAKFKFRIPDFVVYNPGLDVNLIRVGQIIQLPGDIKIEDGP